MAALWVNGQAATTLSLDDGLDRGLQFADGHFTTMRWQQQPLWWDYHWRRLCAANQRLAIQQPPSEQQLLDTIAQATQGQQQAVVKVIITRGCGGRGYASNGMANAERAQWYISTAALPAKQVSIDIGEVTTRLAKQPLFAGLKTLARLEQVMIQRELAQLPWQDALVCDTDGYLVEAAAGNLFWQQGSQWFTPCLTEAGIDGVARQLILNQGWLGDVKQVRIALKDFKDADNAFICNSVRGAVPVNKINGKVVSFPELPAVLQQIVAP